MANFENCQSRSSSRAIVVKLAAGDMIPADVRIVSAKDLFVIQGSLTGESFPVEKFEVDKGPPAKSPFELANIAFLGTSVESGSALAVIAATGRRPISAAWPKRWPSSQTQTAFDRGIARFTWLMLRFMLVMVPLVFVINWVTKGSWHEAFFFALAVAVGLTPEMLPMIVTVCLSKGALAMAREKGHRQADQRHSKPRGDGCAVHRQDRHAHDGSRHPGAALRCRPEGG